MTSAPVLLDICSKFGQTTGLTHGDFNHINSLTKWDELGGGKQPLNSFLVGATTGISAGEEILAR